MTVLVYYVILECNVIFLDLKQMATVCSLPSQWLYVEIKGMLIFENIGSNRILFKLCFL